MSLMVAEVYKALLSAGAPEEEARAAASAIPVAKDLATKQDIAELRSELKQDIAELRSDLKIIKFVYGPAMLLMLAKLVFFP